MNETTSQSVEATPLFTIRVITPTRVRRFKRFFLGCSSLLDELVLRIGPDGVRVNQHDTRHVAFVDCTLEPRFFKGYRFADDAAVLQVSVSPPEFVQSFRSALTGIILESFTPSNEIRIRSVGKATVVEKIEFVPTTSTIRTPRFGSTASFSCKAGSLTTILSQFKKRAEYVTLAINHNQDLPELTLKIHIISEEDLESLEPIHDLGMIWNLKVSEDTVESTYDLDYFLRGLSLFQPDDRISISFDANRPVTMRSDGMDGRKIIFTLAPRVPRD